MMQPALVADSGFAPSPASSAADWAALSQDPIVATATAVSALILTEQHGGELGNVADSSAIDSAYQGDLSELLVGSLHWLAKKQQPDGGWIADGHGRSQLPTTMLVRAAFQLTGIPAAYPDLAWQMRHFIDRRGGLEALKAHFGVNSNTTIIVRGCYALAEVVDYKCLPTIPLETAPLFHTSSRTEFWSSRGRALPAIVALGVAGAKLHKPMNPLTNWRRAKAATRALAWLDDQQAPDGSFADSVPTTSLVLISLASVGLTSSRLVRRGVEYLFSTVSEDGHWPGARPEARDERTEPKALSAGHPR